MAAEKAATGAFSSAAIISWLCQTPNIRSADLAVGLRGDEPAQAVVLNP